jgi:hypothetical protein
VLTQQVEPEIRNGRLDAAATPPAEASCVGGANPNVWKKGKCGALANPSQACAWLPWDRRGRAQIVKAVQDEASPAALP